MTTPSQIDWSNTIVIGKKLTPQQKTAQLLRQNPNNIEIKDKKSDSIISKTVQMRKLETETDEYKHAKLDPEIGRRIATGRAKLNLSRAQLAQQLNVKEREIADYELGKIIPNKNFILKLEKKIDSKIL